MAPLLEVRNVTKRFGSLKALDNVSFSVRRGEILGLIGPNGAGKTTLFNVIIGRYKPDSGRVIFGGRDITGLPPYRIARMGIAKTHQVVRPFSALTVLENVMVPILYAAGEKSAGKARLKAMEFLELVGLAGKADAPASLLNVHEKRLLELARAVASSPRLLLLDEVLVGTNPAKMPEILGAIKRLRDERGVTIIMIEHVIYALMSLAERVVVLHSGRKIADGSPEEVASNKDVIVAYLGDPNLALEFAGKRGG